MKGHWQTPAGQHQVDDLHVHTGEVWNTQYIQTSASGAKPITLSVWMSVMVYLNGEVAYLCSSITITLRGCEDSHLWDSLMALLSPYISDDGHPRFGNDKQLRYVVLWSDHDPWEVREAVEAIMSEAVAPHMLKSYRVHRTTSVLTFDVVVDQFLFRLPNLLVLARTMVAPSRALHPWHYIPRRGCGFQEPLLNYEGASGLRMLAVWRRYRRRSFNKLLRALLKVKHVRCSWDERL